MVHSRPKPDGEYPDSTSTAAVEVESGYSRPTAAIAVTTETGVLSCDY